MTVTDPNTPPAAEQPAWSPAGYPAPGTAYPPYTQYPPYAAPAPQTSTNGFAIASMVLGIVWLFGLGSILAVIFGHIARRQIRTRGESGGGMAMAGVVLGWIGVAFLIAYIAFVVIAVIHYQSTPCSNDPTSPLRYCN
jgi:hypothetical protein